MEYRILFVILTFIMFFPLMILKKKHFGGLKELNYFNVGFLVFTLLGFFGALVALFGGATDSYFISGILYKEDLIGLGSILVLWSGIGMFYTFIIILLIYDKNGIFSWRNFFDKPLVDNKSEIYIISIFSIFSIFSFFYYQVKVFPSPLILAIEGDPVAAAIKRIEVTKDLNKYANTYLIAFGNIVSQVISLQLIFRNNRLLYERILKIFMCVLAILFLLTNGEKAPILFFFFAMYISYLLSNGKVAVINFRLLLYSLCLVMLVYYLVVSDSLVEIKNLVFERVFFAQMAIVYYSLDYYGDENFIGFNSVSGVFNKILDLDVVPPSSEILMKVYFNEMLAAGGWNINGIYISEAWSNYGWFGVILGPIYVGTVVAILYVFLTRTKDSFGKALLIFYTCCSFSFITSLNIYIYNTVFILILFIVFFREFLLRVFKK
ncbi:hypothetical protein [Acinetobacter bereziniae]|uniref:hypothetical protein n=1 Tax=Acinetobacter bereziniae TaxID=106648 RepID=UPI00300BE088